jgi:hypothetical protein
MTAWVNAEARSHMDSATCRDQRAALRKVLVSTAEETEKE